MIVSMTTQTTSLISFRVRGFCTQLFVFSSSSSIGASSKTIALTLVYGQIRSIATGAECAGTILGSMRKNL